MEAQAEYTVTPSPVRLRIRCAWCDKIMQPGTEPTSHGICQDCAEKEMASYTQCQTTYDNRTEPELGPPIRNLILEGTSFRIEKLPDGTVFLHRGDHLVDKFSTVDDALEAAEECL